jgi:hypothetical protein
MNLSREECYRILELPFGADKQSIRKAYRRLVKKYHPDINPELDSRNAEFIKVQSAYDQLLSNSTGTLMDDWVEKRQTAEDAIRDRRKRMREAYLARKKEEEEAQMRSIKKYWFIPFALIILNFSYIKVHNIYVHYRVNQAPDTTVCKVINVGYRQFSYAFQFGGKTHFGTMRTRKCKGWMVSENGFPIMEGVQYLLIHHHSKPEYNYLDFETLLPETLEQHFAQTKLFFPKKLLGKDADDRSIECILRHAYKKKGVQGLSNLFFHDFSFIENIDNNSFTYWYWKNSKEAKQLLKDCGLPE